MTGILTRNKIFITIVAALMVFCLFIGIFTINGKAEAANELVVDREINIAHIADTHYYPLRYCHNDHNEGDFGRMMAGDSKILIESSSVVKAIFEEIYKNGAELDYLVVAGDITKDGEIGSHRDMANGLRFLQNRIREDYNNTDFQIFAILGNHDLYNHKTFSYGGNGLKKEVDNVTRKDISKLYFGLGHPNITYEEMMSDDYLRDLFIEEGVDENTFLPYEYDTVRDTAFIESSNADNIDFIYLYEELYPTGANDYNEGDLSYIAINRDKPYMMFAIDSEDSNAEIGHTAGGRIRQHVMDFYKYHSENTLPSDYTIFGATHRNFLPQFTKQANILDQFVIKDWVHVADFFADLGMRYVFTGHLHATAIMHHISFNNNQITDIETAGAVSYSGGVRYLKLEGGMYGNNYAENLYSESVVLKEVDFEYIFENGYLNDAYLEKNDLKQFIDGTTCTDFSEYARFRIYENIIDNYMFKYLSIAFIEELAEMVKDFIPDSIAFIPLTNLKNMADTIVLNLFDEINDKILNGYEYQGDNPNFADTPFLAFADDFMTRLRAIETDSEGHNLIEVFFHCFYAHLSGNTYFSAEDFPAWLKESLENISSGKVVQELFDVVLNEEYGLYRLISGLLTEELDLTKNLTSTQVNQLNSVGRLIAGKDFDASKVNLDLLLMRTLGFIGMGDLIGSETSLYEFVNDTLDDYVTDSLMIGIGEIAEELIVSFATCEYYNTNKKGEVLHIKVNEDEQFTYISIPREDNPTVKNGKLPSMLTVSFGENPQTDKNFVWFTDKRVNSTQIRYSQNENMTGAITVSGEFEIYAHTYPLIDVGIFATTDVSEIGRHSVKLTGLNAGSTYYYQVGSKSFGYWSPLYKMTTAPADNIPFEALVIADAQGYTQKAYDRVHKTLDGAKSVFEESFAFVMSMGDDVDNSRNIYHYEYLLNTNPEFWANSTQVIAIGNHENYYFELPEDYTPSSEDVVVDEYNCHLMHYNPPYDPAGQNLKSGAYYSYDYSGVHFVVLNTNDIDDENKMSQEQIDWLIDDLESNDQKHVVVIMHKGLYTAGSHAFDEDVINMRKQLPPIFEQYGVNLVLNGHDHTYSLSYYMDGEGNIIEDATHEFQDGRLKIGDKGTLYVTFSTVGDKYYKWKESDEVDVFFGKEMLKSMFGKLIYDGEDLYLESYEYNMETGDISLMYPSGIGLEETIIIIAVALAATLGLSLTLLTITKTIKKRAKKA